MKELKGNFLVELNGPQGTGKTRALAVIKKALADAGFTILEEDEDQHSLMVEIERVRLVGGHK